MVNGYDKVEWGASVEEVMSKYNDIIDISIEDNKKKGIICYGKEYNEGIMSSRFFFFYNGKLYHVRVVFDEIDETSENLLFDKFKEKYGEPTNKRKQKYSRNDNYYVESFQLLFNISNELNIIISVEDIIEKSTNVFITHNNVYDYINPIVSDQIDFDNARKNINNIDV